MKLVIVLTFIIVYFVKCDDVMSSDEENEPILYIGTERMHNFNGKQNLECIELKNSCEKFVLCYNNCEKMLISASQLNHIGGDSFTVGQLEESKTIKTNPCVAMFAYCLSVDFFQLRQILNLESPDDF